MDCSHKNQRDEETIESEGVRVGESLSLNDEESLSVTKYMD